MSEGSQGIQTMELEAVNCRGERIYGTLEQHPHEKRTIVILHGVMGHRNYLFFKELHATIGGDESEGAGADVLPFSTFRIDFHGNGKSEGELKYADYDEDLDDLRCFAGVLRDRGLELFCLLGHSRGAGVALKYALLAARGEEPPLPRLISVSGRFEMAALPRKHTPEQLDELARTGSFFWGKRGQKGKGCLVTQADVDKICRFYWDRDDCDVREIAADTRVLLMHGTADVTVPHEVSIANFSRLIPTNEVRLIEGADHFFRPPHAKAVAAEVERWLEPDREGHTASSKL